MKDTSNCITREWKKNIDDITKEIYDKRINFLIGSGASFGALNTLSTEYTKNGSKIKLYPNIQIIERRFTQWQNKQRKLYHFW